MIRHHEPSKQALSSYRSRLRDINQTEHSWFEKPFMISIYTNNADDVYIPSFICLTSTLSVLLPISLPIAS